MLALFSTCVVLAIVVEPPAQKAVSLATAFVLLAVAWLYRPKPPPVPSERLPVEDFTIWIEIDGLFSNLQKTSPQDLKSAAQFIREDVKDLSANLQLLSERMKILEEKGLSSLHGLRELVIETATRMEVFAKEFPEFPGRLTEKREFFLNTIRDSVTNMGYVHEKLSELCGSGPGELAGLLELLRQQTKKVGATLENAQKILAEFLSKVSPPPQAPVEIKLPEVEVIEIPREEKLEQQKPETGGSQPQPPAHETAP